MYTPSIIMAKRPNELQPLFFCEECYNFALEKGYVIKGKPGKEEAHMRANRVKTSIICDLCRKTLVPHW